LSPVPCFWIEKRERRKREKRGEWSLVFGGTGRKKKRSAAVAYPITVLLWRKREGGGRRGEKDENCVARRGERSRPVEVLLLCPRKKGKKVGGEEGKSILGPSFWERGRKRVLTRTPSMHLDTEGGGKKKGWGG